MISAVSSYVSQGFVRFLRSSVKLQPVIVRSFILSERFQQERQGRVEISQMSIDTLKPNDYNYVKCYVMEINQLLMPVKLENL